MGAQFTRDDWDLFFFFHRGLGGGGILPCIHLLFHFTPINSKDIVI